MKRLIYIPLFLLMALACADKDDMVRENMDIPNSEVRWILTETEQTVNGKKVWMPAQTMQPGYLIIRNDGVILNGDGKASCCSPKSLLINNSLFEVKPQAAIAYVSDCSTVICAPCPVWEIEMKGNEMIVAQCQNPRNKYVRN